MKLVVYICCGYFRCIAVKAKEQQVKLDASLFLSNITVWLVERLYDIQNSDSYLIISSCVMGLGISQPSSCSRVKKKKRINFFLKRISFKRHDISVYSSLKSLR